MGIDFLKRLISCIAIGNASAIPGGRYHNLHDLLHLPNPVGKQLEVAPIVPQVLPELETSPSLFGALRRTDYLLYYPYQSYKYVLRFFNEAIIHPDVTRIEITLYRISKQSQVALALCSAARSGKEVIVFVEVKARYDELNNLHWADEMKRAGVKIFYGLPGVKVHAKVALVTQKTGNGKLIRYAYLSTGNFNEKTAQVYADYGFFTSDKDITRELASLFSLLQRKKPDRDTAFKTLLVAGFNMKQSIIDLIDQEIRNVKKGLPGKIHLKLNGLDELDMITKLYEASQCGVEVKLIIRSGCSLIPGIKGISESIQAYRLVDRYLEHSRVYYFYQNGKEQVYLSSADWMHRNMNKRIEVAFPVRNQVLKNQVRYAFDLQWADNTKLTPISERHSVPGCTPQPAVRAQYAIYDWLKEISSIQLPQPIL
jgi:polyphosphate kinase